MLSARLGVNFASWFIMPMNLWSSVMLVGAGNFLIAFTLSGSTWMPLASMMCPRNFMDVLENSHFSLSVTPASLRRCPEHFPEALVVCRMFWCMDEDVIHVAYDPLKVY